MQFSQVPVIENVYWKELGLLVFVWFAFLALQIGKVYFPEPLYVFKSHILHCFSVYEVKFNDMNIGTESYK